MKSINSFRKKSLVIKVTITIILSSIIFFSGCTTIKIDPESIVINRELRENRTNFHFPVGFEPFTVDTGYNFQMNRSYAMGYARYDDLKFVGEKLNSGSDYQTEMILLAEKAESENRLINAAFYYRAAELYINWQNPKKEILFDKFKQNFYQAVQNDSIEHFRVPYNDTFLPAIRVNPENGDSRGTIILHGGYDSFKEEFYSMMRYFAAYGYEMICLDLPWLGEAREYSTMTLDFAWEKPISAILDYFEIEEASIIGISMGGWLSLRAAAFEPRIKRVIASSVSFDVNQYVGKFAQAFTRNFITNMPEAANNAVLDQIEADPIYAWSANQLMYITDKSVPLEAFMVLSDFNEENLSSEKVIQDVLILTGAEDHLVPLKMHNMQVDALINASSVTPLVFTSEVNGQNHCQIGNIQLAMDVMLEWLEEKR